MVKRFVEYPVRTRAWIVMGNALLCVGAVGLIAEYEQVSWWHALVDSGRALLDYLLPFALIALGIYLLWAAKHRKLEGLKQEHSGELARSATDRRLTGVCGGIAQYLNIDSTVVRIVVLLLFFASPLLALITYVLLACIMPRA